MNTISQTTRSLVTTLASLGCVASLAAQEVDGILSLYPVGNTTSLSFEITLAEGQSLAGLRWYNNDGTLAFPKLLLMEGQAGLPPDLSETGMILQEITGESLAWGDLTLAQPVTSSTGHIHAVFLFPAGEEMTGEGPHGGPGIGYRNLPGGAAAYLSPDGLEWVRLSLAHALAVEPIVGSSKLGDAPTLSSLKAGIDPTQIPHEDGIQLPQRTRLIAAQPNPFNPRTEIRFELAQAEQVDLRVFNLRGQLVRVLKQDPMPAGAHSIVWDGRNAKGSGIASGVYLVQLRAGSTLEQLRVTLVQ